MSRREERIRVAALGATLGLVFAVTLIAMDLANLIPLAGVTAGTATGAAGYLTLVSRKPSTARVPWHSLTPFLVVVVIILAIRVVDGVGGWGSAIAIHADRVSFVPILSPGIALLGVALFFGWRHVGRDAVAEAVLGGWRPLAALFGFAASAQLMNHSGAVDDLASLVSKAGDAGFIVLVPLLAVISGYLVGSNTGANALMAITQQGIGSHFDAGTGAVALQNSGAGHAVFASVPETLLVLAIAGSGSREEETRMLRFGFTVLGAVLLVMIVGAGLTLAIG